MRRKLDWVLVQEFSNQKDLKTFISFSYDAASDHLNQNNCTLCQSNSAHLIKVRI